MCIDPEAKVVSRVLVEMPGPSVEVEDVVVSWRVEVERPMLW